jgi:hypothetical protein
LTVVALPALARGRCECEALSLGSSIHSPLAAAAADPIDHAMATMAMQAHIWPRPPSG